MAQLNYLNGYKPSSEWTDKLTREGFGDALLELGEENPNVVVLDALPVTGVGKVDRRALTILAASPPPARGARAGSAGER